MDEWFPLSFMLLWLRFFPKSSFHSLKVTHRNSCWFSLGLSTTTRLLFPLEFGTKEMKFPSMTLDPHIAHTGETPGSKPTGKLVWIFFFLITLYVFLKWSLTHPMKAKYNKSLINYLMLDIYIGSSYTDKKNPQTLPGCETTVLWHNMFLFISFQKLH